MYRLIYKCPDCGRRPKMTGPVLPPTFGVHSVFCCHTVANNVSKRVAMANWNDMAAAKLARRAAQAQG